MYADMTDQDLGAIYVFLMQSEARSKDVTIYEMLAKDDG